LFFLTLLNSALDLIFEGIEQSFEILDLDLAGGTFVLKYHSELIRRKSGRIRIEIAWMLDRTAIEAGKLLAQIANCRLNIDRLPARWTMLLLMLGEALAESAKCGRSIAFG
jgi:hypothetical protein